MAVASARLLTAEQLAAALPMDVIRREGGLAQIVEDTPDPLRDIAHYAFLFDIGDDVERDRLVSRLAPEMLLHLKSVVSERDEELDKWLAGPASFERPLSKAYLAFTHLRMAADGV